MSDALLHGTVCLTAASAAQELGRCQGENVRGSMVFKESSHVRDSEKMDDGHNHILDITISIRNA